MGIAEGGNLGEGERISGLRKKGRSGFDLVEVKSDLRLRWGKP